MRKAANLAAGLLAGLAVVFAGTAHAATYFADARIGSRHVSRESENPTQVLLRGAGGGVARGAAGDAIIGARAQTDRKALHIASAGFAETYRIVGDGTDLVPVFLTAPVSLRGQGGFEIGVDFEVTQDGEDLLDFEYEIARNSRRIITLKATLQREIWVEPNIDFVFTLETYAKARRGLGSATVGRPVLRLDPDFADRYQLVRTADLPPTGAVPEPGAWALLLTGFGGAGVVLRLRRRGALTAAMRERAA
jgi:hypothetical protein